MYRDRKGVANLFHFTLHPQELVDGTAQRQRICKHRIHFGWGVRVEGFNRGGWLAGGCRKGKHAKGAYHVESLGKVWTLGSSMPKTGIRFAFVSFTDRFYVFPISTSSVAADGVPYATQLD